MTLIVTIYNRKEITIDVSDQSFSYVFNFRGCTLDFMGESVSNVNY